jgi:hypothetical protein
MSAAADVVHAKLLGCIASVVDFGLRPHCNVYYVSGCLDSRVLIGGDGVNFIVDDD